MEKTKNHLTERLVIAVSLQQKQEIQDRAVKAGMGIGEYLREVLFPPVPPIELDALQHHLESLERRVKTLEALTGRGEQP